MAEGCEICRVCLKNKKELYSIFSINQNGIEIAEMLTSISLYPVKIDDRFPKKICVQCVTNATIAYDFKKQYENSYEVIRNLFDKKYNDVRENGSDIKLALVNFETPINNSNIITHHEISNECSICHESVISLKELEKHITLKHSQNEHILKIENDLDDPPEFVDAMMRYSEFDENEPININGLFFDIKSNNSFENEEKSPSNTINNNIETKKIITHKKDSSENDSNYDNLAANVLNIKNQEGFECNICKKVLTRKTHLRRHLLGHSKEKPYSCETCGKEFARSDNLKLHKTMHSNTKPFECVSCNRGFKRAEHLKRHKESKNCNKGTKPRNNICKQCGKAFTSQKYLEIHLKSHETMAFNCKYCAKKFLTKKEQTAHMKTHTGERPYLCSDCGSRFARNDYLVVHMRRHTGEKPYLCRYCDKAFPRSTDLTVHERYHTGEKTHLCPICGKGFQRAYNLVVHTRVHTGERPYKCSHCVQSFSQSNDLKAHIRRHTGERLKCDLCNEGFIQGYHLTQHKRNIHGIDIKSNIRRVEKFTVLSEKK